MTGSEGDALRQRSHVAPVTEADVDLLCQILYEETGMVFDGARRAFVTHRLLPRLGEFGGSLTAYLDVLRAAPEAWRAFVDLFTVNETYFFRDAAQFEALRHIAARSTPSVPFRVWSAGCSVGCEALSLAMVLEETLGDGSWSVIGTDISPSCLAVAERGLYSERELHVVDEGRRRRYFRWTGRYWHFTHPCRRHVRFAYGNVLDPGPEVPYGLDAIFCRNVLIYFDVEARRKALAAFAERLRPGGYLFLGAAETVVQENRTWARVRVGEAFCYVRTGEVAAPG